MSLNNEQKRAVEYLEGPLLVLAGPGTGKTQLLSAKVAYILENTDASPENILCLTFTDAGANNMRDRLRTMVGRAADNVNIYTYHAFGKNLLDRYKNYAETMDRRLDVSIDDTMKYRIIADTQSKLPAVDILRTADVKNIIEVISGAKSARLTPDDLRKIAERNLEDSRILSEEISPILEAARKGARAPEAITKTWQPVLEVLVSHISEQKIVKNIDPLANLLAIELQHVIETAESDNSAKPLTNWRNNIFEKDDTGKFRLKNLIANKKLLSIANIMKIYNERLEKDGLYDFDDMIEETIKYLKTDDGFRLSLSELFQYVLLDEFQDTNPSQFELIKLLTDYEKPIIMAVGDDDQAIYEFQGANASNLMDFEQHYQAEHITLVENYRSTGEILDFSRQIADQITDSFSKKSSVVDKNLRSVKDREKPSAKTTSQITRHEFPCAEAEYDWVAEQICDLIDRGEDPNEIAILAPKHKNLVAILPYLKSRNLNIAYEKRENLLDDEIMHQIIQISNFIYQLASGKPSAHLLMEILSYDFWELSALEIIQLFPERRATNSSLEILSKNDNFKAIANFFSALALKSTTAPLEIWLNYLIGVEPLNDYRSPFLAYYQKIFSEAELLEFYENLATFRQTVLNHATTLHPEKSDFIPKLEDFVATINDYLVSRSEIMRISNYRDTEHSVQVMTAFKSKGLEFKHVFLTAVDNRAWGTAKGNNNTLVLPKNLAQIRHTGNTDDEKLRVLFVALTRAKETLTLTNARADHDGKNNDRLNYLNESSREDLEAVSPYLPAETQKIAYHDDFDTSRKISTLALGWVARYKKYTPEFLTMLQDRVENYRLNPSDLTKFIDIRHAGPEALYRRLLLHEPDAPTTFHLAYGNLIHAVFEQVTNQKISDSAAMALFRDLLAKLVIDSEEKNRLSELGEVSLKTALEAFSPILRHDHAKGEVNLSHEHLNFDGIPLSGKIDHIHLDPAAKTIELYDFKTGSYKDSGWNSDISLYKYRLQLGFYKILLNLSPTYRNYTVTRGHILFVTPDQEGKVHDKVYEFNDKDETELKNLMRVVYREISTLDFLHQPDIFIPADENATMRNVREFVDKLLAIERT